MISVLARSCWRAAAAADAVLPGVVPFFMSNGERISVRQSCVLSLANPAVLCALFKLLRVFAQTSLHSLMQRPLSCYIKSNPCLFLEESSWSRPCLLPPALQLLPLVSPSCRGLQAEIAFALPPSVASAVSASRMRMKSRLMIVLQNGAAMTSVDARDDVLVVLATKSQENESFEDFDSVALRPQLVDGVYLVDCPGLRSCRYIQLRVSCDSAPWHDDSADASGLFAVIRDVQFFAEDFLAPPLTKQTGSVPVTAVLARLLRDLPGAEADLLSDVVLTRHTNAIAWNRCRRVWNGLIDRFPAIIVVARSEDDVCRSVALAHELSLEVTVKGGGHNVAGSAVADGALMIDLSLLNSIAVHIDQAPPRITVGGGCTWAAVDAALHPHALAVPAGDAPPHGFSSPMCSPPRLSECFAQGS
jgi:hypothetical protein